MTVLGIDPSLTATGCVKLKDGSILSKQLIKTKPSGSLPIEELGRLQYIRDSIDTTDVKIAAVEGLAMMSRKSTSLVQLSGLNYFIREYLQLSEVPFIIVPPTVLKKFITGKGNSPKELMLLEVYKRYGVSFDDNNTCDAYCLARICHAIKYPKEKITKIQQDIIKLLKKQL